MSADVQPRKRKDKKKKRDSLDSKSEVEITVGKISLKEDEEVKESHHGVHATKMGADDVHLHIQADHSTGGHWCAKIFFFSLLAILLGLIGLIIIENRGLSDLDTPLSESRFSEYFEGWVDEHRQSHDDHHDKIPAELEDHDAEPFEEEEDHSEIDEDEEHDEHEDHEAHEEHEEHDDNEEEADATEDADDDDKEQSEEIADEEENQEVTNDDEDDNDNDNENEDDDGEDDAPPSEEYSYTRSKREVDKEPEEDDDDEDEGFGDSEDTIEATDDADDDENEENTPPSTEVPALNQEDDPYDEVKKTTNQNNLKEQVDELYDMYEDISRALINNKTDDNTKSENINKKDDDDFESLENVVDNDADEQVHLEQKAKQGKEQSPAVAQEEEEPESSSVTLKVFVGVALAFVARLVLIKNTDTSKREDPAISMRRRLTMISAEEPIPPDDEEPDDIEEECLEEEQEEDEVVELSEEEVVIEKYVPETFEQLNAMYRPKGSENTKSSGIEELRAKMEDIKPKIEETQPKIQEIKQTIEEIKPKIEDIALKKEIPRISSEIGGSPIVAAPPVLNPIKSPDPVSKDVKKDTLVKSESSEGYEGEDVEELSEGEEEEEVDEEELGSEEEDISEIDDDDDDLMKRLEAKYGKLPERQYDSEEEEDVDEDNSWTKIKSRQGGGPQSYTEDELIEEELRRANEDMLQNNLQSALKIFESLSLKYPDVPGALYGKAKALDRLSEKLKSNQILLESILAYKRFLALDEKIDDDLYLEAAERCIDRMRFQGLHLQAVPIHRSLIERFPQDPRYRNQLSVTYLLINRFAEAKAVLNETLLRWPNNGFAQVHFGFVIKNLDQDYETAVTFLLNGIKSGDEGTQDGRFYFHLGDALQRLGRTEEARQVYREGAKKKLFLSEYQRSLYNVENIKAQPFWTKEETGYKSFLEQLEKNWEKIRNEGLEALNQKGFFVEEAESLRDFGDWKQFELFARGNKNTKNCAKAPTTCGIIEMFPAARFCKRGQTKFSVMHPNTHVWPHCGPTNCRLRAHLGLKVPPGTKIRVAQEERTWEEGKFLIFDDSFEHEVWHNGTSVRLVLIVDVWHPELTEEQREKLSPI